MFEQVNGAAQPEFRAPAMPPPLSASRQPAAEIFDLRPLTTGEILDRTFTLYRGRFWLYCGLSALAASVSTVLGIVNVTVQAFMHTGAPADAVRLGVVAGSGSVLTILLYYVAFSVTQAATISAVSAVYLGHDTTIASALQSVRSRWWRYLLISLWQFWSATWLYLALLVPALVLVAIGAKIPAFAMASGFLLIVATLACIPYGIIAYIRNALGIPAAVVESLSVRASMKRSKRLMAGHKGRMFLVLLLLGVLSLVAGGLQIPFLILLTQSHAGKKILVQGLALAMGFITNSLIAPVGAIAFCLFYIDERVRKEGFDIEALMDPTLGTRGALETQPFAVSPLSHSPENPFAPSGFTAVKAATPPASPPLNQSPFQPSGFTAPTPEKHDGEN